MESPTGSHFTLMSDSFDREVRVNLFFKIKQHVIFSYTHVEKEGDRPPAWIIYDREMLSHFGFNFRYNYKLYRSHEVRPNMWYYRAVKLIPRPRKKYDDD